MCTVVRAANAFVGHPLVVVAKRLLALGGEGDKRDPLKVLVLPTYELVAQAARQLNVLEVRSSRPRSRAFASEEASSAQFAIAK
jgi:hypothetical protein